MRVGLAPRILFAGAVVVCFLAVEFGLVLHAFGAVRAATDREQRAERTVIAADRVEKLVLDLETGTRGYVVAHDPSFLAPWLAAQRSLPEASRTLLALDPGPRTRAVDRAWRSYLTGYSRPLVRLARSNRDAGRSRLANGEGKRRVDRIRALIDPYVAETMASAAADRRDVARQQHAGMLVGISGIAISIVLLAGIVAYFLRAAVLPLRRIAAATGEVAAGRAVDVSERAPGEVGQLAAAFNEMSRSLARSQASLAEQNVDLERLANLLRVVLDATVDGILLSDRNGAVQLANRPLIALAKEIGMSMGPNVVDNLLSVADTMTDPETFRQAMERLRANPDSETLDEFEHAESGRVFQGFTSPVHDLGGGFAGRIWTLREVTRQRELDRMKDDFVATVSHELRTPLTSMMGFLEMLTDGEAGELSADQRRFLSIVYRSSERLQRLVGDLLFVARLDANGLQLHVGEARLDEIVAESVEASAALARARGLDLRLDAQPLPPLHADRERLAQVVGNLLSNALKFTPSGGTVTARTFLDADRAVVEVEDTGIGIPEAEQGRLFERFFRSSTAAQQAIPGTGLGLVIARAIAEAHGGAVSVRSAAGAGTCFRVELPLEPVAA